MATGPRMGEPASDATETGQIPETMGPAVGAKPRRSEAARGKKWRIAEVFTFDTCTYKCAYCLFAEYGMVLDSSQLKPYRDPDFIRQVASFFNRRVTDDCHWLLQFTGGEPLLMPNFALLGDLLGEFGNRIALYTAMMIGRDHPSFRYLLERAAPITDYLMVSFHPEAEAFEEEFFTKLKLLKEAGHSVIFRFVGHPKRLHRLDELSEKCRQIDVSFYPTPLFSPDYPSAYTSEEREQLHRHMASISQIIQMANGIDTSTTRCHAANTVISLDLRSGRITPCASVWTPLIGHLYEDWLHLEDEPIACPAAGISCLCDIHFQQNIVVGADDRDHFARHKAGWVAPVPHATLRSEIERSGLGFSAAVPGIGQTQTSAELAIPKEVVRARYQADAEKFTGSYRANYAPEFRSRQDRR